MVKEDDLLRAISTVEAAKRDGADDLTEEEALDIGRQIGIPENLLRTQLLTDAGGATWTRAGVQVIATKSQVLIKAARPGLRFPFAIRIALPVIAIAGAATWWWSQVTTSPLFGAGAAIIFLPTLWYVFKALRLAFTRWKLLLTSESLVLSAEGPFGAYVRQWPTREVDVVPPRRVGSEGDLDIASMFYLPLMIRGREEGICFGLQAGELDYAYETVHTWLRRRRGDHENTSNGSG
jgi:hypothetical protein